MKGVHNFLVTVAILALAASVASAFDPSPLQDFCVATNDTRNALFVNGKFCKDPRLVTASAFFSSFNNIPEITSNRLGITVKFADVNTFPGLNTQGISLTRMDFKPLGQSPPHTHPRASEIIYVDQGTLYAAFVSSVGNRLFSKTLKQGDVFVIPFGLVHFLVNPSRTDSAVAFSALSSQNGGLNIVANTLFGSHPAINPDVLTKALQLDRTTVEQLQQKFG